MMASSALAAANVTASPDRLAAYDPRVTALLARLAEIIARPIGRVDLRCCDLSPLSAEAVEAGSKTAAFARPLNALVARQAGLDRLDISKGLLDRLCARPASRLSAALATSPEQRLSEIARRLAAAALHPRIVLMPQKTQRLSLIAAFGEEDYRLATREAPLRYTRLGDLSAHLPADFLHADTDSLKNKILGFGAALVFAFLEACEKELAVLTRLRWPELDRIRSEKIQLADVHRDLILRLCVRSIPSWSPIIA